MIRRLLPSLLALLLLALAPAAATLVLSDVSFAPTAPLQPGSRQQSVSTFAIIPSGSTTFPVGHSLQMQTNLPEAHWTIQVTLDRRDAARQTAAGSAAFVNGEILSYGTNHDVGMIVTIDGIVPQAAGDQLVVLQVREIDNSGSVVPGSILTISQPVATPTVPPTPLPVITPQEVPTPGLLPTKAGGFALMSMIAALCGAVLLSHRQG